MAGLVNGVGGVPLLLRRRKRRVSSPASSASGKEEC